jgi:ABC-type transporter Mla MlaB component
MTTLIEFEDQRIAFTGDITFPTVQSLEDQIMQQYSLITKTLVVDFARAGKVDTSALALCLSLQRLCVQDAAICFENIPQCLLDIAASVGVEKIFNQ